MHLAGSVACLLTASALGCGLVDGGEGSGDTGTGGSVRVVSEEELAPPESVAREYGALGPGGGCPDEADPPPDDRGVIFSGEIAQREGSHRTDVRVQLDGCESYYAMFGMGRDAEFVQRGLRTGRVLWSKGFPGWETGPARALSNGTLVYLMGYQAAQVDGTDLWPPDKNGRPSVNGVNPPDFLIPPGILTIPEAEAHGLDYSYSSAHLVTERGFLRCFSAGDHFSVLRGDLPDPLRREVPFDEPKESGSLCLVGEFSGAQFGAATGESLCSRTVVSRVFEKDFVLDVPGCTQLVGIHPWKYRDAPALLVLVLDFDEGGEGGGGWRVVVVDPEGGAILADETDAGPDRFYVPTRRPELNDAADLKARAADSAMYADGTVLWAGRDATTDNERFERVNLRIRFPSLAE